MAGRSIRSAALGSLADPVADAVAQLERDDVVDRIWNKDHTVWRDDPAELADRLGWLTVISEMRQHDLKQFAREIKDSLFNNVVILGMGGSSLGPEVIARSFGSIGGFPHLSVLDSTVPSAVRALERTIDPSRTLFLVSSKSGTTIEPNCLYRYFRGRVEDRVGKGEAGLNFAAITDPGTPLSKLADEEGFRRVFENPSDIGGRYSVLSLFGLVPAALVGVDIDRVQDQAVAMVTSCKSTDPVAENPGVWLGAFMAAATLEGRDKLTLVTSPRVSSFGLWLEQLIAESTGKEGKGVVPVAAEPLLDVDVYGDDRAFVYLRVDGDDNAVSDVTCERLAAGGHPVVQIDIADAYGLGAEFFRWEFATAVAGCLLDIQPFDQPDVQAAKDATSRVLADFEQVGELAASPESGSLGDLIKLGGEGDYVSFMGYVQLSEGFDGAMSELRKQITNRTKLATTFGYGPRFLHSTGQLHKGGPNKGLFVQLVTDEHDIEIPGSTYGFATLAAAQALGDYEALIEQDRRVIRINLGEDAEAGLLRLLGQLASAG